MRYVLNINLCQSYKLVMPFLFTSIQRVITVLQTQALAWCTRGILTPVTVNILVITVRMNWEFRWGLQKSLQILGKVHIFLPKKNGAIKLCQQTKGTSLSVLFKCVYIMEFLFNAILCSNLSDGNSDGGHVKCLRGPQVAHHPLIYIVTGHWIGQR